MEGSFQHMHFIIASLWACSLEQNKGDSKIFFFQISLQMSQRKGNRVSVCLNIHNCIKCAIFRKSVVCSQLLWEIPVPSTGGKSPRVFLAEDQKENFIGNFITNKKKQMNSWGGGRQLFDGGPICMHSVSAFKVPVLSA